MHEPIGEGYDKQDMRQSGERPKRVENIGEYETQKIEVCLSDAERLVSVIRAYLERIKYADAQGILLKNRLDLSKLRFPGALFEPNRDGGLGDMSHVFEDASIRVQEELNRHTS